jgi:small conductance mechanosensitive channel
VNWDTGKSGLLSIHATIQFVMGAMPIDFSNAWKSGSRIINFIISLLPNIVLGLVILITFLFLASAAKSLVRRLMKNRGRRANLGLLLGQLTQVTVAVFGFLVALSAVAPSFHASDLIKMLGVGSVAIGFAFQNILQNFLAGILLLFQEPFRVGDWISVAGLEGRVDDIQARATLITDANSKKIVIPNAVLFTSPVTVGEGTNPEQSERPTDAQPPSKPTELVQR